MDTKVIGGITYEIEEDPFGQECRYDISSPGPRCPSDNHLLSDHISGKPCVSGQPSTARNLWDLPIFGAMWAADARDLNA